LTLTEVAAAAATQSAGELETAKLLVLSSEYRQIVM
jgi:hypothetical protein